MFLLSVLVCGTVKKSRLGPLCSLPTRRPPFSPHLNPNRKIKQADCQLLVRVPIKTQQCGFPPLVTT